VLLEGRFVDSEQALDDAWNRLAVSRRGETRLGISFRPLQVEAFGLDPDATLDKLLRYPFHLIRLAAYWNRIETRAGVFDARDLDRHLEAADRAGKQVIISVGAVKNFGYPEFYVPDRMLDRPLKEGSLVRPSTHPALLSGATRFIAEIVKRYRDVPSVVAWQLEHEAVDPLGVEHSWRLGLEFVQAELDALREADPSRPVLMNGFLPTSSVVRVSQWWNTRDQGDSIAAAARMADIVGIDYYPRHALFALGRKTLYLDAARLPWQKAHTRAVVRSIAGRGKRLMVSEGQAEPWEAVTSPPNPAGRAMFSCRPQDVIENYNAAIGWSEGSVSIEAYLFWGAEYWVLRDRSGDPSYLRAFGRILEEA
jgi:Beta-galactosidase